MKKMFALIWVIVLCLSLCACGGENENKSTESTIAGETLPEETGASMESFIESAVECDFATIREEYIDNPLRTKSYYGQIIKATGHITSIYEDHVTIVPLNSPFPGTSDHAAVYIDAYFSYEDLTRINKGDVIDFVGKIEEMTGTGDTSGLGLILNEAFYVDDSIEFIGEVTQIAYDWDASCVRMDITTDFEVIGDNSPAYKVTEDYPLSVLVDYYATEYAGFEFKQCEDIVINDVTVVPKMEVRITGKLKFVKNTHTSSIDNANNYVRYNHVCLELEEITNIEIID